MFYDKKIKYFDYMENEQRLGCGGFVKMEARDNACNIMLQVSGLPIAENSTRKVYLLGENKKELLCEILLKQGKGNIVLSLKADDVCGGISYNQIREIQIPLSPERELVCFIVGNIGKKVEIEKKEDETKENEANEYEVKENEVKMDKTKEEEGKANELKADNTKKEETKANEVKEDKVKANAPRAENAQEEAKEDAKADAKADKPKGKYLEENLGECGKEVVEESIDKSIGKGISEPVEDQMKHSKPVSRQMPLADDKWKQLFAVYPHFAPFQDEREYLSVGLGDFVILQQKYYKLVNNSFLLHGYYNYKHLILARVERRGEVKYYIGVPGNFYEREKQVALMFGFESFECREEPAREGDFGYYMIGVEI